MNLQSDFFPLLAEPTPVIKSDSRVQLILDIETLLLDPMPGIADSVGWAMIEQGLAPTVEEMEQAGIGRRPISQVLSTLLGTEDTCVVADVTARYHSYFNDSGRFRCRVRESGVRLAQVQHTGSGPSAQAGADHKQVYAMGWVQPSHGIA